MAKDTRVTFDSATPNNNNGNNNGAMSPNGMGGGNGGGGALSFNQGHHLSNLSHQPHHAYNPHKSSKIGRHSRIPERQVSTEDAENCINEFSESFPALSNKAQRLMRQVSGSFNSRTLKVALIFSILLNIIMGISFGVFFGMWMSWGRDARHPRAHGVAINNPVYDKHTASGYHSSKTIPLSNRHNAPLGGVSSNTDVYNAICALCTTVPCANPSSPGTQRSNTDAHAVPGRAASDASDCLCMNDPNRTPVIGAHMMLDVYKSKKNQSLIWLTQDDNHICFVSQGLRYSSGKLTVLQSGTYYVYSQITYDTHKNSIPDGGSVLKVALSILREPRVLTKESSPTVLLSQLTVVPGMVENDSVGGSIRLMEGDTLSAFVSHPSLLKDIPEGNFFGLYKV